MSADNPDPAAPEGLILDACTASGDGGRTRQTLANIVQDVDVQKNALAAALENVATAQNDADSAVFTANQAAATARDAKSTAEGAIPQASVAFPGFDQVPGMKNGNVGGATGSFQGAVYGQGYQQSWNDPPGVASTSHINISPQATIGGHIFYDLENNATFDDTQYGCRVYSKYGFLSLGKPNVPSTMWIGRANSNSWQYLNFFSAGTSYFFNGDITDAASGDASIVARGGTGNGWDAQLAIRAANLVPDSDGAMDLGGSGNRFNNLFLAGTVNQTSDATEKDVVTDIYTASDEERAKYLTFYESLRPILFKFKTSTLAKGDAARLHVGVLAQDVEAALKKAGLDPAGYSIWSSEALIENVQIPHTTSKEVTYDDPDTGTPVTKTVTETTYTYETRPILDADGNPRIRQSLNYTELLMLMVVCQELKQRDLDARLTALEVKRNGK